MQDQMQLLTETDWRLLIILDACRADRYGRIVGGDWQPVRSPAPCTNNWINAVGPLLAERAPVYYTTNPVIQRQNRRRDIGLDLRTLWGDYTTPCGVDGHGTVHPWAVNTHVLRDYHEGEIPADRAIVVHYIQPHYPYLASAPGYDATLLEVSRAAEHLALMIDGTAVITSDHGELLGEDGERGHPCQLVNNPILRTVPWAVRAETTDRPGPTGTMEYLKALGYA